MIVGIKKHNLLYLTEKAKSENLTISETVNRIIEWASEFEQRKLDQENVRSIIKELTSFEN